MAGAPQPARPLRVSRCTFQSLTIVFLIAFSCCYAELVDDQAHSSVELAHSTPVNHTALQHRRLAAAQALANHENPQFQECGAAALYRPKIMLIGDSHTERGLDVNQGGWVQKLQWWYNRKADVLVRGFSGYQSRWWAGPLFNQMKRTGELQGVQMAIVFLGSNDARLTDGPKGVPQALYVSPDEFEKNMNSLVDKLLLAGVQYVVLVSPPPVCDQQLLQYGHTRRTRESTRQYAQIVGKVAKANIWKYVDMWTAVDQTPEYCNTMLQPDGLHLSYNGQSKLFQLIRNYIGSDVKDMRPEFMTRQYPDALMLARARNPDACFTALAKNGFLQAGATVPTSDGYR